MLKLPNDNDPRRYLMIMHIERCFGHNSTAFSMLEAVCTVLQRREGEAVNQDPHTCAVQAETSLTFVACTLTLSVLQVNGEHRRFLLTTCLAFSSMVDTSVSFFICENENRNY